MQSAELNPNLLAPPPTFSYKDILIRKLVRAVAYSIASQIVILLIYIIIANVNLFDPLDWLSSTLNTFTRLSTWIFVIVCSFIIFAQCLICAKDYVLMVHYCPTRFQQLLYVFSFHNFILLMLHIVIGGAFTWQILVVIGSKSRNLTMECKSDQRCLVEDTFFLIMGGFWTGFYFFLKVYMSTRQLMFPIIHQKKILQLRTNISVLFKQSFYVSIWPTVYFAVLYYIWGQQLEANFMYLFKLDKDSHDSSILIYLYLWWFATLYCFSMNLMRFFFQLFLTEPVEFPIIKENEYILTLPEALGMSTLPIIQNLACLDLFMLSQWSPIRRQLFFTLSQPGGHPHNWNALIESVIKLFTEYTDLLKKSIEQATPPGPKIPTHRTKIQTPFSPICLQKHETSPNLRFRNMRDMTGGDRVQADDPDLWPSYLTSFDKLNIVVQMYFHRAVTFLKVLLGIDFFFGVLPGVNVQKSLGTGQLIIWASQGITELATASLTEDKYGIVQKDLPLMITTLVELKQNLDILSKLPALSRQMATMNDFNYKMKNAINAGVKHSLFSICLHFGQYFNELPLCKDVVHYLQTSVVMKSYN